MDLGRSSHIHITTWGTLSRQKKGQRSKGPEGASIITLSIALSNTSLPVFAFPVLMLTLVQVLLVQLVFFSFLRLGEGRPLQPLRTTTLIQTRAPHSYKLKSWGFAVCN